MINQYVQVRNGNFIPGVSRKKKFFFGSNRIDFPTIKMGDFSSILWGGSEVLEANWVFKFVNIASYYIQARFSIIVSNSTSENGDVSITTGP